MEGPSSWLPSLGAVMITVRTALGKAPQAEKEGKDFPESRGGGSQQAVGPRAGQTGCSLSPDLGQSLGLWLVREGHAQPERGDGLCRDVG